MINELLWRSVERFQKYTAWKRAAFTTLWVIIVVGVVYVWTIAFDCPICHAWPH